MVEVKRKRGETFESFVRRFNKRVQQSGRLLQAKKVRFLGKQDNKLAKKTSALYRKKVRSQKEYLRKIGKLPEDNKRGKFKR